MILSINYSNELYKSAQKFNSKTAIKFGADKVIEYNPNDIPLEFQERNKNIWNSERGGGYWLWKPYIIKEALDTINDGDYLIYSDAGSCFVNKIEYLICAMDEEKTDIMLFSLHSKEKCYTKRDAFILLNCDEVEFSESTQRCGTYMIFKKSRYSEKFIQDWLIFVQDERIVTDNPNVLGKENYKGFISNRHDQSVLSLLSKKYGIKVFRDPCQYGNDMNYDDDILARSPYPQIIDSHRFRNMPKSYFVYKYIPRNLYESWCKIFGKSL